MTPDGIVNTVAGGLNAAGFLDISYALRARFNTEVHRRRGSADIARIARGRGMRTLQDDGARLVAEGVTTPEEVLRVVVG